MDSQQSLAMLEEQINSLLAAYRHAKQENQSLKQANAELTHKNQMATQKIQDILKRLKQDQDTEAQG